MVTEIDGRTAIERELGLCLDLETRGTLLDGLRLGPGSREWSDALGIVALREMARAIRTSPSRERADAVWRRIDQRLRDELPRPEPQPRGHLVEIVGRIVFMATVSGALLVAIWCLGLAIWRWL